MDIEITFLGTGSAIPTQKRNHPSILISYDSENILIDCAEGTQRQFRKAKLNPCKLTKILITHWHADHTLGLPGLFETLAMSEYQKTLKIYGPRGTKEKINLFEKIYGKFNIKMEIHEVSSKKFIDEKEFYLETKQMFHGPPTNAYSLKIKDKLRLDKTKLKKLNLPNSPLLKKLQEGKDITINKKKIKASSITYEQKGKKITIILDTKLNPNIQKLAKDSDLLICEASFSSKEKEKAEEYKHLTAKQTAEIAKKSNSKSLYLVHTSQRYDNKTKPLLEEAKKIFENTKIPEDLEKIKL